MILYPKEYFSSVKEITIDLLRKNKINALILDVDNTLIDYDKNLDEEIIEWANNLKEQGIKLYILSNSNKKEKVKTLILIGQTATKIYDAVKKELEIQNKKLDIHMCETFQESLDLAKRIAKPGQIVLFSPASTSFDMFKDMYDRGDKFKEAVDKF